LCCVIMLSSRLWTLLLSRWRHLTCHLNLCLLWPFHKRDISLARLIYSALLSCRNVIQFSKLPQNRTLFKTCNVPEIFPLLVSGRFFLTLNHLDYRASKRRFVVRFPTKVRYFSLLQIVQSASCVYPEWRFLRGKSAGCVQVEIHRHINSEVKYSGYIRRPPPVSANDVYRKCFNYTDFQCYLHGHSTCINNANTSDVTSHI